MATTVDQLLEDAQAQVWAVAVGPLPDLGRGRRTQAAARFDALRAAWPDLAAAAIHALESAPLDPGHRGSYDSVTAVLRGAARDVVRSARVQRAEPDPRLLQAARLTAAAGDALRVGGVAANGSDRRVADRVLALVESGARLTAAYAEQGGENAAEQAVGWLGIASCAAEPISSAPGQRSSPVAETSVIEPGETGLASRLEVWRSAALEVTGRTSAPTADLPLVSATLVSVYSAAAVTGAGAGAREAASSWQAAAQVWGGVVRIPGRRDTRLDEAGVQLGRALHDAVAGHRDGSGDPHDVALLSHFAAHRAPSVADAYRDAVETVVTSELAVIPARRLVAEVRPVPVEVAAAARAGRWVPLPREAPSARALVETTRRAAASVAPPAGVSSIVAASFPRVSPSRLGTEVAARTQRSRDPGLSDRSPGRG